MKISFEEKCSLDLFGKLPAGQVEKVFKSEHEIQPDFLGFVYIYKNLSEIIPKHFTIIDLGCAYNPQCFFFTGHKKYIAVDVSDCAKFKSDNCIIYEMTIGEFIKNNLCSLNLDFDETFAICSYVPFWYKDNSDIVRSAFKNLFVFYPSNKSEQGGIS